MNINLSENPLPRRFEAFSQSFLPCERRIASYVFSLVPNRADAEDIIQDVSVVLWEKFESFTPGTDFASWACRIAFLKILDYRRLKPRPLSLSAEVIDKVSEKFLRMGSEIDVEQKLLVQCIDELDADQGELIRQRHFPGITLEILANKFSISIPTLRKRLQMIYTLLMRCITKKLDTEDL